MAQELQCCPLDNLERPGGGQPLPLSYREKVSIWFLWSAAAILVLTGLGKISSAFGTAQILTTTDPIFGIPFRVLLPIAGALELAIAALCLWKRFPLRSRLLLVAWVSTMFVTYRIGLWAMDWHHPCGCLGSLAGVLHITDQQVDTIMKLLLAYLTLASFGLAGFFVKLQIREHARTV